MFQDVFGSSPNYQGVESKPGPSLERGVRGQNKVSALAKDLAIKFAGETAPPPAKREALPESQKEPAQEKVLIVI